MDITVKMTAEEFEEFRAWMKDRDCYKVDLASTVRKWETFVNKVCWALGEDPKRPGKVKIIDQEHAEELLEMVKDFLA